MVIVMPWGRHKGVPIVELESGYLVWLLEHADNLKPYLATAIRAELQSRFGSSASSAPPPPASPWKKPCPDPRLAASIIATGFKQLARRHHPDVGGDTVTMQQLNSVMDWLKGVVPQ